MGTEHDLERASGHDGAAPELARHDSASCGDPAATKIADLSHGGARSVLLGVSEEQAALLHTAGQYEKTFGAWPTAAELACAAFVALPVVWQHLRVLRRLGCVLWTKSVQVVREPDGVVREVRA